jgi:hypothetical protein
MADNSEKYTCGYCGKVMLWNEIKHHNIQDDYNRYKANHPDFKGAIWLAMILDTMNGIKLSDNSTHIVYTPQNRGV